MDLSDAKGPGERALRAMAEAARRAREATALESRTAPGQTAPALREPSRRQQRPARTRRVRAQNVPSGARDQLVSPPTRTADHGIRDSETTDGVIRHPSELSTPPRALRLTVIGAAALVILSGATLLIARTTKWIPSVGPVASQKEQVHQRVRGPAHPPAIAGPAQPIPSPGSVQAPTASAGNSPQLTSLAPPNGSAGQTVVVTGMNLFSPDGRVQAFFSGQEAPTSCTSETSCTVTVPDLPGPQRDVPVTIVTEAGTSNAIFFSYG